MSDLMNAIVSVAPLCVYLILSAVLSTRLKIYQGLYLILGAVTVYLAYSGVIDVKWFYPFIVLVAGEITHVVIAGLFGIKLSVNFYAVILGAVGLAPFYLGKAFSGLYIFLSLIVIGLYSWIKYMIACRKFGLKSNIKPEYARKKLTAEDYESFARKASIRIGLPIMVSAVSSVLLLFS